MRLVRSCVGIGALCIGAAGSFACDSLLGEEDRFFVPDDASDAMPLGDGTVSGGLDGAAGRDGSRGDAGDDAAGGDASGGDDGGGNDAGPFCASGPSHYICSDFDEGALYYDESDAGAQWIANLYGAGLSQIVTTGPVAPVSPPGMLQSTFAGPDGGTTGTGSGAALALPLPNDLASLQLDFDLFLPEQIITQGAVNLFAILQTDTADIDYGTWVEVDTGGLSLVNFVAADNGPQTTTRVLPQIGAGWQHVRLVMQRAAAGHLTLSVGGMVVVDQDMRTVSADTQELGLFVGLNADESTSLLTAYYDNVTFDFTE
jgi:hypothetical protein